MRRSARDAAADRQRELFGVDKLERLVGDVISEVVRLVLRVDGLCVHLDTEFSARETAHLERLKAWLLAYEEQQSSEWNMGPVKAEVRDGKAPGSV